MPLPLGEMRETNASPFSLNRPHKRTSIELSERAMEREREREGEGEGEREREK